MKIIYDVDTGTVIGTDDLLLIDTDQFTSNELDDIYNGVGFPAGCRVEAVTGFTTEPVEIEELD